MHQIVTIDNRTFRGKLLITLLKEFQSNKMKKGEVSFITPVELEEMEDKIFGKMIEEGRTGKYINTDRFLKILKSK